MRGLFAITTLLILAGPFGGLSAETSSLPARVQRVLDAYDMAPDTYSAWVQAVDDDQPLFEFNSSEPRNPASTIKLLTTFLALEDLGPAYTWDTEAYLDGELDAGRLQGDLIIKGYGDPYLVTERLWLFLRGLRQRGLQTIEGDLVIDNTFFDLESADPGEFDGQAYRIYNVQPDAMLVNFNAIGFVFRPDAANRRVDVVVDPQPSNLEVRNRIRLSNGRCGGYQRGIQFAASTEQPVPAVSLSGSFGSGCTEYQLTRAVLSAPEYAYGVIDGLWKEMGGEISGGLRVESTPDELEAFHRFSSPPVTDVIRHINKWSNNVMTRQIFLTMAAERLGPPATVEKARIATRMSLEERGLDFPELYLDNGSGLSRETRISARNLGRLLRAAHQSPFKAEYESSLALAGLDGTMRRRFRNEELTGRMHLKTGRLNGVFAVAGFLISQSGREYVVVAIQNENDAHRGPGEEAHGELLRWVHDQ